MDLRRVDVSSLQLVEHCALHGSLSMAAKYCNTSISRASTRISQLEMSLGYKIFKRHRGGMALTERGEAVAYLSAEILRLVDSLATGAGQAIAAQGNRGIEEAREAGQQAVDLSEDQPPTFSLPRRVGC